MDLDNTGFSMYCQCPLKYFERYHSVLSDLQRESDNPKSTYRTSLSDTRIETLVIRQGLPPETKRVLQANTGIELIDRTDALAFGSRFHQLVESRRLKQIGLQLPVYVPSTIAEMEDECQATFAAYENHYLPEPLEFLEAERTHRIPIPGTPHNLIVKLDGVVRHFDGTIGPLDTKTEAAGGANNHRENWAGKSQASLYLWALSRLYPNERVSRLIVDVVTRGNSKRAPVFRRIDDISRTPEQLDDAIRNFVWVCDDIELSLASGWWRSNRNICKDGWKKCDYYELHVIGRTEANLKLYQIAERYLDV